MTRHSVMLLMAFLYLASGNPVDFTGGCLLQRRQDVLHLKDGSCAPLHTQGGMYFTIKLCVGTPEQCFDAVADTGSNAVIVPSCVCDEMQGSGCAKDDPCFRGTNTSSSFQSPPDTKTIFMTFGSGTIEAAIATDVVKVGSVNTMMKDGVLLMVSRAALQLHGEFQGILGLGVPKDSAVMPYLTQETEAAESGPKQAADSKQSDTWWHSLCAWFPLLCDDAEHRTSPLNMPVPAPSAGRRGIGETYEERLFLAEANIDRFSLCFRDGSQSGAMRVDLPPFEASLKNIGTFHWGLDFRGISVGERGSPAPAETLFCGPETVTGDMDSPCGIIPDSGTTLIVGPKEQVLALETDICSRWGRCHNHSQGKPSSTAFRELLFDCGNWLTMEHGLQEIPSIFFHVKGGDGAPTVFELTAWAWVTEASNSNKVCSPSLGHMEYHSQQNGPIWVFGTPLFYEYNVGFDISTKQISLQKGRCEPCSAESGVMSLEDIGTQRRRPRAVQGEPRISQYDTNMPL